MQPHPHSPAPDAEAPWATREQPPKRPAKKSSAKKSSAKKSPAKKLAKKSAAKKPAKKSTAKQSAKNKPAAKKSPAERPAAKAVKNGLAEARAGIPRATETARVARKTPAALAAEFLALLSSPDAEKLLAALRHAHADDIPRLVEAPRVAALERKLAELERQLAELAPLRRTAEHLEHRVAELSTLVAELQSRQPDDGGEVLDDPFAWIRRDPSIAQYHGQHVALHPTRGVVAHAFQLDAVVAEVRASGLPLDDIVLDFIADSPF